MDLVERRPARFDQDLQLLAVTAAELDQRQRRIEGSDDVLGPPGDQLRLGARDLVPRQPADGVEQRRSERIVEVLRRQLLRRPLQRLGDFGGEDFLGDGGQRQFSGAAQRNAA